VSTGQKARRAGAHPPAPRARTVSGAHYVGQMVMPTPEPRIEVRRSRRRTRTISAHREHDAIVVLIPARLSAAEEQAWVTTMVERVTKAERRRQPSDDELAARADDLSRKYLAGLAEPASVRWVDNQRARWGSCTPTDRSIRISSRVRPMPPYVVDYVLLHELAHLLVPGHDQAFWAWVSRYPRTERARGFLEGVSATAGLDIDESAEAVDAGELD
jgi:predicted metal-dependent hydrolase